MTDYPISEESAEEQFGEFLEYYQIEFKDIEIEDGPESAETLKNTLMRAIRRGQIEIKNDAGFSITHTLANPTDKTTSIVYHDKVAKARLAMDSVSPKKSQQRMYEFMSSMGNVPVSELTKLKGSDVSVFTRLATIFSLV